MTLQGHPRSLNLAPIESAYRTSLSSIVTIVLSCRISEILELFYAEGHNFCTPPLFLSEFRGVTPEVDQWCWVRWVRWERTPKLSSHEIIFEEFQSMWSRYLNVTDGQTDGRLAVAIPRSAYHRAVKSKLSIVYTDNFHSRQNRNPLRNHGASRLVAPVNTAFVKSPVFANKSNISGEYYADQ